jgi:hypothetical protein
VAFAGLVIGNRAMARLTVACTAPPVTSLDDALAPPPRETLPAPPRVPCAKLEPAQQSRNIIVATWIVAARFKLVGILNITFNLRVRLIN